MSEDRWTVAAEAIATIYEQVDRLEAAFPERRFTPDGHLVGSIGEVLAAHMFDLKLLPSSGPVHDAVAPDGRSVQIKLTQGRTFSIYGEPNHLIALQREREGGVKVIYNGPGDVAWSAAGTEQKNGQRRIGVSRLARLMDETAASRRLPLTRPAPL